MTALNKQALREAAIRAGGVNWIYIRTLSLSNAYITEETGATVINCTAGDVPAKCAGFLELANPATVLALLDELEAAEKRIAEHNFENRLLANADRDIKALRQSIAELEVRTVTVKLPSDYRNDDGSINADMFNTCVVVGVFREALAAAGIGVKGE
ncbi:TPA: ead/Ea22-like family protein [Salmonella enterica subsp. enterica serovar Typhimurium]